MKRDKFSRTPDLRTPTPPSIDARPDVLLRPGHFVPYPPRQVPAWMFAVSLGINVGVLLSMLFAVGFALGWM